MRRIACVALPEIRVEIAREKIREETSAPLAVVVARPGGTVKSERDILGNTRLDVVSREARAMGVRAGQTVAAARAKVAALRVRVVAEGAVRAALERIAEAALAFGPATGLDVASDVVWVDVGGCAHLHGGEAQLARALEARVVSLGHACRVAVADGPRIASAVARLAVARCPGPLVVPEGRGAAAMRRLPVAALALDDDVTAWLRDLGLPRCGDLQKLPRRSLGVRLGARTHDVMQLLDGEDRAPLDPWRPAEVPEERMELEWGAASIEALAFVL
jgi:protein ImuB